MGPYEYWLSCVDVPDGSIIHFITDPVRSTEITYRTFAQNVNLAAMRQENHPAMYRVSCPDNWSISFHRSALPNGQRIYYFNWSRIEHIFVDPEDGWPDPQLMVRLAQRAGY